MSSSIHNSGEKKPSSFIPEAVVFTTGLLAGGYCILNPNELPNKWVIVALTITDLFGIVRIWQRASSEITPLITVSNVPTPENSELTTKNSELTTKILRVYNEKVGKNTVPSTQSNGTDPLTAFDKIILVCDEELKQLSELIQKDKSELTFLQKAFEKAKMQAEIYLESSNKNALLIEAYKVENNRLKSQIESQLNGSSDSAPNSTNNSPVKKPPTFSK